jgi:hypothetical protein
MPGYPLGWKILCREILKIYIAYHLERTGEELNPPTLSKKIREASPYPTSKKDFTRFDIGNFLTEVTNLSDPKFYYVDNFINSFDLNDHIFSDLLSEIKYIRDKETRKIIVGLYGNNRHPTKNMNYKLNALNGKTFVSYHLPGLQAVSSVYTKKVIRFKQICLYFHDFRMGCYAVSAAYFPNIVESYKSVGEFQFEEYATYFGYFVPGFYPNDSIAYGKLLLFRPEVKGLSDHDFCSSTNLVFSENMPEGLGINLAAFPSAFFPAANGLDRHNNAYKNKLLDHFNLDELPDGLMHNMIGESLFCADFRLPVVHKFMKSLTNGYLLW